MSIWIGRPAGSGPVPGSGPSPCHTDATITSGGHRAPFSAHATRVDVRLSETNDSFVLHVHDNGVGISEEALRKPTSHGIRGMRERAREHGGDVSVSSAPDEGTTLVVTIPKARAG